MTEKLLNPTQIDPSRIPDNKWEFERVDEDGTVYSIFWVDRENGVFFRRTQNMLEEEMLHLNSEQEKDSHGMRFGNGRVIARVPLNKFYEDLAHKIKEGDADHMKYWLNHEDNRPFRSFRGKV